MQERSVRSFRRVLGIRYDDLTVASAAQCILALTAAHKGGYVVTPNAEIAQSCFKHARLYRAVSGADLILPDGAGVVLASRIIGAPLNGKTPGIDVAKELLRLMSERKMRLYLLGAKPGVAEKAAKAILDEFPGVVVAGTSHGYFDSEAQAVACLSRAQPDVVFVALGSPRQELFMSAHKEEVKAVMLGVGGTVDVLAGEMKRAPDFFVRHSLEWFYRLLRQPHRLFRMMKLPKYILRAVQYKLRRNRSAD